MTDTLRTALEALVELTSYPFAFDNWGCRDCQQETGHSARCRVGRAIAASTDLRDIVEGVRLVTQWADAVDPIPVELRAELRDLARAALAADAPTPAVEPGRSALDDWYQAHAAVGEGLDRTSHALVRAYQKIRRNPDGLPEDPGLAYWDGFEAGALAYAPTPPAPAVSSDQSSYAPARNIAAPTAVSPAPNSPQTPPAPEPSTALVEAREELFLLCPHPQKYGDDGEMQCAGFDFKRRPWTEVREHLFNARLAAARAEGLDVEALAEAIWRTWFAASHAFDKNEMETIARRTIAAYLAARRTPEAERG